MNGGTETHKDMEPWELEQYHFNNWKKQNAEPWATLDDYREVTQTGGSDVRIS